MASSSTQSSIRTVEGVPHVITEFELSSLVSDLQEDHSHGGPSGATVNRIEHEVITRPTDGSPVFMDHDEDDDSTSGDTVRLRFYTNDGGSLAGAKVKVRCIFNALASGGIHTSY